MHIIELGRQLSAEERYPGAVPKGPLARPRFESTEQEAGTAADKLADYNSHRVARRAADVPRPRYTAEDVAVMVANKAAKAAAPFIAPASLEAALQRIAALEAKVAAQQAELDAASSTAGDVA